MRVGVGRPNRRRRLPVEGEALSGVPDQVPRVFYAAVVAVGAVSRRLFTASRPHAADNHDEDPDPHAPAILDPPPHPSPPGGGGGFPPRKRNLAAEAKPHATPAD